MDRRHWAHCMDGVAGRHLAKVTLYGGRMSFEWLRPSVIDGGTWPTKMLTSTDYVDLQTD